MLLCFEEIGSRTIPLLGERHWKWMHCCAFVRGCSGGDSGGGSFCCVGPRRWNLRMLLFCEWRGLMRYRSVRSLERCW
jgi:hypothetical protein